MWHGDGLVRVERIPEFMRSLENRNPSGYIFTHFARGDEPNCAYTLRQIEIWTFAQATGSRWFKTSLVHAANSGGIINYPQAWYD